MRFWILFGFSIDAIVKIFSFLRLVEERPVFFGLNLIRLTFCGIISNYKKVIIMILSYLLFSGCSNILKREYPQKKFYILEPDYSKLFQSGNRFPNLGIAKIKISPYFEGKSFVYRQGDYNYESDYYNEFFVFPSNNIQEIVQKWIDLSKSSVSGQDLYSISIYVDSMYIDLRKKESPKTVWSITFSIQNNQTAEVVYKKKFTEEVGVTENTPEAIVNSWNLGLTKIFSQLYSELNDSSFYLIQSQSTEKTIPNKKRK